MIRAVGITVMVDTINTFGFYNKRAPTVMLGLRLY
jgi:hypothetical protein